MWHVRFAFALYFSLAVLPLWGGDASRAALYPLYATIRRNDECLNVFTILSKTQPTVGGPLKIGVRMTLTPGCEIGPTSFKPGIWPEFSEQLRFEFELGTNSIGGAASQQRLYPQLISDYQPPWMELRPFRTLEFELTIERRSVPEHFLLVTLFSDTESLGTITHRIPQQSSILRHKRKYSNPDYRYSVRVPDGFVGIRGAPPFTDHHGILILLSQQSEKPERALSVHAKHDALRLGSIEAIADRELQYFRKRQKFLLQSKTSSTLQGLGAIHMKWVYRDSETGAEMIHEQITMLRPAEPGIVYRLALESTAQQYAKDAMTFKMLVESFKLLPMD